MKIYNVIEYGARLIPLTFSAAYCTLVFSNQPSRSEGMDEYAKTVLTEKEDVRVRDPIGFLVFGFFGVVWEEGECSGAVLSRDSRFSPSSNMGVWACSCEYHMYHKITVASCGMAQAMFYTGASIRQSVCSKYFSFLKIRFLRRESPRSCHYSIRLSSLTSSILTRPHGLATKSERCFYVEADTFSVPEPRFRGLPSFPSRTSGRSFSWQPRVYYKSFRLRFESIFDRHGTRKKVPLLLRKAATWQAGICMCMCNNDFEQLLFTPLSFDIYVQQISLQIIEDLAASWYTRGVLKDSFNECGYFFASIIADLLPASIKSFALSVI
ncbi:hypothetical protein F5050DRAFT_327508 [Lentinula boryana]|uniref:MFS general substrate transporter n=1 Tax=Lentinula boryana TaxID=40481 RepID=A0ABQ8QA22_9AGAR|nr:hypothetical protein F5050DRAFT_327508 [Lentinula boryana]